MSTNPDNSGIQEWEHLQKVVQAWQNDDSQWILWGMLLLQH
jgi:hypothetical protein